MGQFYTPSRQTAKEVKRKKTNEIKRKRRQLGRIPRPARWAMPAAQGPGPTGRLGRPPPGCAWLAAPPCLGRSRALAPGPLPRLPSLEDHCSIEAPRQEGHARSPRAPASCRSDRPGEGDVGAPGPAARHSRWKPAMRAPRGKFSKTLPQLQGTVRDAYKRKRPAGCSRFDLIQKIVSSGVISALCSIFLP
jgi:hypothetical protein